MKPILFNTEMVRAILDGRKTTTRRIVKPKCKRNFIRQVPSGLLGEFQQICDDAAQLVHLATPPYQKGDILYVRETFAKYNCAENECIMADYSGCNGCTHTKDGYCYVYKSSHEYDVNVKWKPSIFMPKEAARIFLRVTDVRAERLQGITEGGAKAEGATCVPLNDIEFAPARLNFGYIWDCTVKKSDLDKYGWDANQWVWVYEFERCEKPKEGLI
jgi:hypothetical protein